MSISLMFMFSVYLIFDCITIGNQWAYHWISWSCIFQPLWYSLCEFHQCWDWALGKKLTAFLLELLDTHQIWYGTVDRFGFSSYSLPNYCSWRILSTEKTQISKFSQHFWFIYSSINICVSFLPQGCHMVLGELSHLDPEKVNKGKI